LIRSVWGPGELALDVPAVGFAVWFSNESLTCRDLTGVWLERGARARRSEIRSARRGLDERDQEDHMSVIIGVDPHKGSHTAVAIGGDEARLAKVKVRATRRQVDQLLEWAARFDERTWAIESASGLGYLLAQQLLNAGERVVDVPATLAARVRVLGTGRSNKNDPNCKHRIGRRRPRLAGTTGPGKEAVLTPRQPGHRFSPRRAPRDRSRAGRVWSGGCHGRGRSRARPRDRRRARGTPQPCLRRAGSGTGKR
jgi:hypothetical protein